VPVAEVATARPCPACGTLVTVSGKRTDEQLVGTCRFPGCKTVVYVSSGNGDPASIPMLESGPCAPATNLDGTPIKTDVNLEVDPDTLRPRRKKQKVTVS